MGGSIRFGTDGWRAVIAEDFTFDNVRICAQAVAAYLRESVGQSAKVVVGYDTRFGSEDFAAASAEVLAANGLHVYLTGKAEPTPVVSHAVVNLKADGGIVITASHNPGRWNGFKYKGPDGSSAPMEVISEVERHVAALVQAGASAQVRRLGLSEAMAEGLVERHDPSVAYIAGISRLVDLDALRQMSGTMVVDSMYGAGSGYFARLLGGSRLNIEELNSERNPLFPGIRPEPITPNLARLRSRVPEAGALLGIATDGDADRVGIVDEQGQFMTQHQVFALLCHYLLAVRQERGDIIRSVTTTEMISLLGQRFGVPVHVTAVGFKYIAPLMLECDALIGGEESGGYGFRGHIPERDGILAGLYFLDYARRTGKTPSRLLDDLYELVGPHHYDRLDQELEPADRARGAALLEQMGPDRVGAAEVHLVDRTDGVRLVLRDGSWLLFRLSGTEPLVRIYAEAESMERVRALLSQGRALLGLC